MRVNFHKHECIPLNVEEERAHEIAHTLSCPLDRLPFKYLGVPLHYEKLKREDLQPMLDKLIKRISGWRGRLLAYSSRLVLIKSYLASIHVYLMSFFKFSKWAIKLIESQMANCLWNDDSECHRYHLASWQHINMEKDFGGLGVPNLRELNIYLLASWIRRYFVDRDKIWKQVVDHKYNTASPNVFTCRDNGASNFWKGVLWAARVAKMGYRWRLGNERKVRFWEDVWDGNSSLSIQFWEVYIIVNEQNKIVDKPVGWGKSKIHL
jgi:hypothetical protein